jgi:hypothetical protein
VSASAHIDSSDNCDDISSTWRSVTTNANNESMFSGDKHSNNGNNDNPHHALGSFAAGHRNDIAWSFK